MPLIEDTDVFFDTVNGFAQKATVDGMSVIGNFDQGFQSVLDVETSRPSFTCGTGELPGAIDEGSCVAVKEGAFKVSEVQRNGAVTTLFLYQN